MSLEKPICIGPVTVDDYSQFRDMARRAALIVYRPEYFKTPFRDDARRLKRVTVAAVGVRVNGIPMTFRYVLSYEDMIDPSVPLRDQSDDISKRLLDIVSEIESSPNVIRGSVDVETSMGELLARIQTAGPEVAD
ncbi:MAG: hypothetical protein QXS20_07460 [Candidatus Thorarchaeota archaeon]